MSALPATSMPKLLEQLGFSEAQLAEAIEASLGDFVDPLERAGWDPELGGFWRPVGALVGDDKGPADEVSLETIRRTGRDLEQENGFACNILDNLVNYTFGTGFEYRITPRAGSSLSEAKLAELQLRLDDWLEAQVWEELEAELSTRAERDGEFFLRFFSDRDLEVRVVDPEAVATPQRHRGQADHSFGIQTDPDDVATRLAYWIDGEHVEADEVMHARINVDRNVKRGISSFWPVRNHFKGAVKVLEAGRTVARVQASIVLIRKHSDGARSKIEDFAKSQAHATVSERRASGGIVNRILRFMRPSLIDAPKGVDYEFPTVKVPVDKVVAVVQSDLRAAGARWNAPEWMISGDASNNAYASSLVAEGPFVKRMERRQLYFARRLRRVCHRWLDHQVRTEVISGATRAALKVEVQRPQIAARDQLKEAQRFQIETAGRVRSKQSWAAAIGLDWKTELAQMERELELDPGTNDGDPFPPTGGDA